MSKVARGVLNDTVSDSCVILLHGLCRTRRSMEPMHRFLELNGFEAFNLAYPSTRLPIVELAELIRPQVEEIGARFDRVHFVTHSMGGILLRQMQRVRPIAKLGRCVMLAPPNRGSQVVDRLGSWGVFRWLNGPAGCELGTGPEALPLALGKAEFEVGILAGKRSINWILSLMLPSPNDGKVAVSHAKLEGQRDFRVLPVSHPFIMRNALAQANTLAFLESGAFLEQEA